MPLLPLDLSAVSQSVFTVLLVVAATVWAMKRAASACKAAAPGRRARELFVVDGGFEGAGNGGGEVGGGEKCASCGKAGSKQCSGCKRIRYCSKECQLKHWRTGHQYSCKLMKSSNEAQIVSSRNGGFGRHKSSRFGAICLVPARGPCNSMKASKKILFPYDEFVKLFNWNNPGFRPCGLINCGNSCYANVVLQCLSCTRPLVAYLLERDHSRECVRKRDGWCFLCELQAHVQRAEESFIPFSPMNFLSRLRNIGGNLGYGRQEDAHEFIRFAIDTMQSICLGEFGGEKALDPSTQETTLIQYIFGGHLRSQVTCTKCNMTSGRYENMMDLTVEIHGDAESLEQCLDQFTSKEWLDGDNKYKCDGCNDYVKAWKRLTVHQAPNILTIALKRFQSGRFGKLNKRVSFPESLDLSPYMSGSCDGTDLYTLYAVVVHVDMLNASYFGHYICYTKDNYGQWYRIDDREVMNAEVEDVLSECAYMLLYSRISARKEPSFNPGELHRTKQPTKVIQKETENARGASPTSVSCFPTSEDGRLTDSETFHLRDTKYDTEFSDDLDYERASCKVLDALPHERSRHVCGDSEDMDTNKLSQGNVLEGVSSCDSSAHGNISLLDSVRVDVHPEISLCKVDIDKCHVNDKESQLERDQGSSNEDESTVSSHERSRHFCGGSEDMGSNKLSQGNVLEGVSSCDFSAHGDISLVDSMRVDVLPEISTCEVDTDKCHVNDKESQLDQRSSNEEASTVSTSVLDKTNTNHNIIDTPTGSFFTSHNGSERRSCDCSGKSTSESENSKLSAEASNMPCSATKIDSVVGKDLAQKQIGSSGEPKDTFLRGFLNKKYSDNITKLQSRSNSSSQANGYCNGHVDLDSVDKVNIVPQNGKDATSNDGSFMSSVLKEAYISCSGEKTRERMLEDQCEINCVTPLDNNRDVRPQTDCSHGASLIKTSHQLDLRPTLTDGISNGICNKDGQLEMLLDGNGDDNLLECEKPQTGYGDGHNG